MEIQAVPQWLKCYCVSNKGHGFMAPPCLHAWPALSNTSFRSKSRAALGTEGSRALWVVRNYWWCPNWEPGVHISKQELWLFWGLQRSPAVKTVPLSWGLLFTKVSYCTTERYKTVFGCCRVLEIKQWNLTEAELHSRSSWTCVYGDTGNRFLEPNAGTLKSFFVFS